MSKLLQVYEHDSLTVTFDARRCIHAAECVKQLPAVFDPGARPWIRPALASADETIAAVHRCPTGALRVARSGVLIDISSDTRNDVSVRVLRNGPLYVRGDVRVLMEDGTEVLRDSRTALCRCGHSRRQPLCDGSHRSVGFRDPAV